MNKSIDTGKYRDIKPITIEGITLLGWQFTPDKGHAWFMFNIDGCFYDYDGFFTAFNKKIDQLFPDIYQEIVTKYNELDLFYNALASSSCNS